MDESMDGEEEAVEPEEEDTEAWRAYRNRRRIRAFPNTAAAAKQETVDDEGTDMETPRGSRNGKRSRLKVPDSTDGTPSAEASANLSDVGNTLRPNRKRRGEELLLLDDHLLPEEIRRIGTMNAVKKDKSISSKDTVDQVKKEMMEKSVEPEPEEDEDVPLTEEGDEEQVAEEAEMNDEDAADDNEEEDQGVTRCICGTEGKP